MSDQTTEAKIQLSVEVRAADRIKALKADLDSIAESLKQFTNLKVPPGFSSKLNAEGARKTVESFNAGAAAARRLGDVESRTSRQRQANAKAEASDRRMFDAADVAAIRTKMGFVSRMNRQRVQQEAAAERQRKALDAASLKDFRQRFAVQMAMGRQRIREAREAERAEAAAVRTRISGERRLRQAQERTRREAMSQGRKAFTRGRDAARDLVRPQAALAAAGAAVSGAGARRILKAEGDVDSSEINARIYGGLSKDAARQLRDRWAAPLAESLGSQTDKLLDAYTEATKVGIPAAGAQAFAELATKTSEAWAVPFETVTETLGTVNSILTSKGAAFDGSKLKSVANTLQHLAARQSTTPEKLISFLQRGAGGADVLGMSMESALAFGSASTSLGNQAGQSGSLLDYIASRVVEMPKLTRQHGQEGKQARELVHALGYGSAQAMDAKRRADPDAFLPDLVERFHRIRDPKKQEQAIRFFTGREWLGEFGRIVKGADTYREAQKLAKEAKGLDAIGAVWELHRTKLAFVFKQFRAGWLNILGEFGKVLSPMARQAGDYFLAWSSKLRAGGLATRFKASLDGFLEGLGFRDLPDLLKRVLGEPGQGGAGAIATWRATFREFGAGISDVVGSIKSVVSAFTGGDPEVIARWTGRILALSVALVALSPVLGVLRGLASGITAIVSAATGIGAALKLAGIGGAAFWTTAGGLIGVAFLATIADKLGILKAPDVSKGWGRGILEFLDPGIASRVYGDRQPEAGQGRAWSEPPARVQKQSSSLDWHGLIKPAAFNPADEIARNTRQLVAAVSSSGARMQLASFGGLAGFGGLTAPGGTTASGGSSGPGHAGMQVPGWYGRGSNRFGGGAGGSGGGSASSNPANSAASAAMLDAIAGTESGKAGYDAVLGNGKYGTPSKPVSTMSLDEAFAFGRQIKARHGSSSALGRYQIVGNTMRAAQSAMGIPGTATFDAAMQDRMARWIARNQGLGAWEGLKGNPRAMAAAQAALAQGSAKDVPAGAASVSSTGGGQFDGLRVKGGQATAGGGTAKGVTDLARAAQADLPGGVKHFSAFNDRFHQGTRSKHALGLAFDTTLLDPSKSAEAAEAIRAKLRAAGLSPEAFRVIDEYRNPSSRSTGGHLHTQFSSREAAEAYHRFVKAKDGATVAGADGMTSTGWRKAKPTAADLAGQMETAPKPVRVIGQDGQAADMGGSSTTVHAPVTINAGNQSPQEIAGAMQRHVSVARNFRVHDMEPELT